MLARDFENSLSAWFASAERLPLLVRGARQVGKTWTIGSWAKKQVGKANFLEINFEERADFKEFFKKDLVIDRILDELSLATNTELKAGKTLIFFDEIQLCPAALTSLRYFYEKRPDIPVIAAGSLLEFVLEEINFPVGRVTSLFMYPLTFFEYLRALGKVNLYQFLMQHPLDGTKPIPSPIHEELLIDLKRYYKIGGMPKAVAKFLETESYEKVSIVHEDLLQGYRSDFPKYAKKAIWPALNAVFSALPYVIASPGFKYVRLSREYRVETIKNALLLLEHAGIVIKVLASAAQQPPLAAHAKPATFKLLFLDIGLLQHALGFDWTKFIPGTDLTNVCNGVFAEQFVGQELVSSHPATQRYTPYYWDRSKPQSDAEVDYLIEHQAQVAPLEVKSGVRGTLKSLLLYQKEFAPKESFIISARNCETMDACTFLPLYLAGRL